MDLARICGHERCQHALLLAEAVSGCAVLLADAEVQQLAAKAPKRKAVIPTIIHNSIINIIVILNLNTNFDVMISSSISILLLIISIKES